MIVRGIMMADGTIVEEQFPSQKQVCHRCRGEGYHLVDGMRDHAYSYDEFTESFDEEEQEEYFRVGGRYDQKCEACSGKGLVDAIDESACSEKQMLLLSLLEAEESELAELAAIEASERKHGA